jgi:hypothetical protein
MINLEEQAFLNNSFHHSVLKDGNYNSEELSMNTTIARGVDVSQININEYDIVDRSSSDEDDNESIISSSLNKLFR